MVFKYKLQSFLQLYHLIFVPNWNNNLSYLYYFYFISSFIFFYYDLPCCIIKFFSLHKPNEMIEKIWLQIIRSVIFFWSVILSRIDILPIHIVRHKFQTFIYHQKIVCITALRFRFHFIEFGLYISFQHSKWKKTLSISW